jgi:lysozyme
MRINPLVVDISHYDHIVSLATARKAGIVGVIHKATEGPGMVDTFYARRRDPVRQHGMLWGAYHFLRCGNVAVQVAHFLSVVGNDPQALLALDHEDPKVPLINAVEFLQRVYVATQRWPVLYSGFLLKEQLEREGGPPNWGSVRLWLAHYSPNPSWPNHWSKPFLWQFTGDGQGPQPHNVPGILIEGSTGIDVNSYDGTADELAREWPG